MPPEEYDEALDQYICFTDNAALAFWDDTMIYADTQQGIYYEIQGTKPDRQTVFEFYLSSYNGDNQYYHFLVRFYEDRPGVVTYQYLNVSDHGGSATVGVQGNQGKPANSDI